MRGIRFSRPLWTVALIERDKDGRDDGWVECNVFWNEADAIAERDRLAEANTDVSFYYVVSDDMATGVYPADETPPWIQDPDRLKERGYEMSD